MKVFQMLPEVFGPVDFSPLIALPEFVVINVVCYQQVVAMVP